MTTPLALPTSGQRPGASAIDSPTVVAARLTGQRRAFVASLVDADLGTDVRPQRAEVFLGPDGLVNWSRSPLPGDVSDWHQAAVNLGGVA